MDESLMLMNVTVRANVPTRQDNSVMSTPHLFLEVGKVDEEEKYVVALPVSIEQISTGITSSDMEEIAHKVSCAISEVLNKK